MGDDVLRILTVCSHNRTRSVMSMAMLQHGFDRRLGAGRVIVRSLGFGPEGVPAIDDAVRAMSDRHLDVSDHRSRKVTPERIAAADLVVTAEKEHVLKIAGHDPDVARRTFTLPEFIERASRAGVTGASSVREWVASLSDDRVSAEYLEEDVTEIWDPTGSSRRRFARSVDEIAGWCAEAVRLIVGVLDGRGTGDPTDEYDQWAFDDDTDPGRPYVSRPITPGSLPPRRPRRTGDDVDFDFGDL